MEGEEALIDAPPADSGMDMEAAPAEGIEMEAATAEG